MKVVYRYLCVLTAALCSVALLSACSTKVGAAATVGGKRITESQVAKQVLSTTSNGTNSRITVLEFLLVESVYEQADPRIGVDISDAQLRSVQTKAAQTLLNASIPAGQAGVDELRADLARVGINPDFVSTIFRALELEYAAVVKLKATSRADLGAKVRALGIAVSVSPRYGSWDKASQDLAVAKTPSFLKLNPTPTASAA